jgi:hypothetical protein
MAKKSDCTYNKIVKKIITFKHKGKEVLYESLAPENLPVNVEHYEILEGIKKEEVEDFKVQVIYFPPDIEAHFQTWFFNSDKCKSSIGKLKENKKPVLKKPVLKKPVLKKPVLKKPVLKKPVLKKPVLKKKIIINNKYTYMCDKSVRIGSEVKLPTPQWMREFQDSTWVGKVTSLKSDYNGVCESVIEVLRK